MNRDLIVVWMAEAYETAGWLETVRTGWRGAFIIDPFGSLLEKAIRRLPHLDA